MEKRYDFYVTTQNTPHFKERRILFLLSAGIFLLNLVLTAFFLSEDTGWFLSAAFLYGMFSICQGTERRTAMWTWGYIIFWILATFITSACILLWYRVYWWFIGYGIEIFLFMLIVILLFKRSAPNYSSYRKFCLCPVWQCSRLDSYFEEMERNGYRLVYISHSGILQFKEANPKDVRYFCTHARLKERGMNGIEDELRSQYGANPISSGKCFMHIHRITDLNTDLTQMEKLRRTSLFYVVLERLLCATVPCLGIICLASSLQSSVLISLAFSLLLCFLLYYLTGLYHIWKSEH